MKLFKRNRKVEEHLSGGRARQVAAAEDALSALSTQMRSGAESQQAAAKRMASLNRSLTKLKSSLAHVERLEAENVELESALKELKQNLRQKTAWADEQEKGAESLKRQRNKLVQELEIVRSSQSEAASNVTRLQTELRAATRQMSSQEEQLAELRAQVELDQTSIVNLTDALNEKTAELTGTRHRMLELQKASEELGARFDHSNRAETGAQAELKSLRVEHSQVKDALFAAKGELQSTRYALRSQKASADDISNRRAEEIALLKNQIEQLSSQLRIKESMAGHVNDEADTLRQALTAESAQKAKLSAQLMARTQDLEQHQLAMTQAKQDYEKLRKTYAAVVEDVETLRKINLAQKERLNSYAQIGSSKIVTPSAERQGEGGDIRPRLKAV